MSRSFSVWDSHGPVANMGLELNRLDHPRVVFFFFLFGATGVCLLEITSDTMAAYSSKQYYTHINKCNPGMY